MPSLRRAFLLFWIAFAATASTRADANAVIAKARAYLGSEEALNGVKSIHYSGVVEEAVSGEKSPGYKIDMIFQKEFQQRLVVTRADAVEITALNDYEAWHRVQDPARPASGNTGLYSSNTVKQLRASTWENMAFFAGIEKVGGTVIDDGEVDLDGKKAHKLSFVHEPGIVYIRYFEPETGRLLGTETDLGVRIREEGEIISAGIRFPKRIINSNTGPDGKEHVVTVTIESVTVNETFPDDIFGVPLLAPP
ncbi:MAG TPA: hypothetical protein VFT72_02570 [Opitutaceae bacterium]|nr:hypothetical protein [Opitutaceae bacterium]